jgi:hypothetical protein
MSSPQPSFSHPPPLHPSHLVNSPQTLSHTSCPSPSPSCFHTTSAITPSRPVKRPSTEETCGKSATPPGLLVTPIRVPGQVLPRDALHASCAGAAVAASAAADDDDTAANHDINAGVSSSCTQQPLSSRLLAPPGSEICASRDSCTRVRSGGPTPLYCSLHRRVLVSLHFADAEEARVIRAVLKYVHSRQRLDEQKQQQQQYSGVSYALFLVRCSMVCKCWRKAVEAQVSW